jgi:glycosyltransferase involved in cell wall biosynthesis
MRVMLTTDAVGGVWTYALELVRYMSRRGIEVHLCVLGPAPTARQKKEAESAGANRIEITDLPLDWTAASEQELDQVATQLQSHAKNIHADIVHLNAPAQAGVSQWPLPLIVTAHSCVRTWWNAVGTGPIPEDLAWRAHRTAAGVGLARSVITPSAAFARDVASAYGKQTAITAIHNGRGIPSGRLQREARDTIILTAGRLWDKGKNLRLIDDAAWISGEEICAAGPLQGPNGETIALRSLRHIGSLDAEEMNAYFQRTAIFVSASKYEPFGLAVLEAAQSGAALVLSDIPSFRELWDGAALFFNPDDAFALAGLLRYLTSHAHDRADLAAAAQTRARHYSIDNMGARTLEIYEASLSASTRHSDVQGVRA